MADEGIYTNDGTVDIHKKPAIKSETGNWRACKFVLGVFSLRIAFVYSNTFLLV